MSFSQSGGEPTGIGVKFHYHINNLFIPVTEFTVVSGSYGSVGSSEATTSRAALDAMSVDLMKESQASTIVPVTIYVQIEQQPLKQIFDGDLVSTEWDIDTDVVKIHSRDHAGIFVDQKRILARDANALTAALSPLSPGQQLNPSGVSTMNRKISQVVTDIAQEFGYTAVLNMDSGSDVQAGAVWGSSDHTYMTIPQNLWSILNTLARDTGNEVYTTPDRKLVFGTPGAGLPTINLQWGIPVDPSQQQPSADSTQQQQSAVPTAQLRITHNPRRHSTFRVLVISYDAGRAAATIGRATVIGDDLAGPGLSLGIHSGADAKSADEKLLSNAKTKGEGSARDLSHVQLYTFHWDGLTNDDANARAAAIATDISKRLLQLRCIVDGMPALTPTQKLMLRAPRLPSTFTGNTWYTSGFRHIFRMPRGVRGRGWDGFTTEIQALDLPNNALASAK